MSKSAWQGILAMVNSPAPPHSAALRDTAHPHKERGVQRETSRPLGNSTRDTLHLNTSILEVAGNFRENKIRHSGVHSMSRKRIFRVVSTNVLLFGILFGLVSLNKELLRPSLSHIPVMAFATGSFPNFIAACMISLFFVNGAVTMEPRHSRLLVYLGSLLVFIVLTIEEVNPIWGASKCYDVLDIIATGAGSLLAIITYELIFLKRKTT
jgi:hypothetical protein